MTAVEPVAARAGRAAIVPGSRGFIATLAACMAARSGRRRARIVMKPLVWTNRSAAVGAALPILWLLAIELGTSRTASRRPEPGDVEVDDRTSRRFDAAAAIATGGGVLASIGVPSMTIRHRRASWTFGVATLFGAGALSSSARRHLGRFHRDTLTRHADHELITSGPYGRVRHPLYAATIGVFVGLGAVLGNRLSLALATLPTAVLVHRIRVEERMLLDEFGLGYEQYRARTAAIIPGVW